MDCLTVEKLISAYLDRTLDEPRSCPVSLHLSLCPRCAQKVGEQRRNRQRLRTLPRLAPPPELSVRLRVLASRERAKAARSRSRWRDGLELAVSNLMRPLALPLAGGLCSTVVLFSMLVPAFTMPQRAVARDVPTVLFTDVSVKSTAPIGFSFGEAVVDLRIDEQGRIVNYVIVDGDRHEAFRRNIENSLLFTQFTPATSFGMPVSGTIRLTFRSSRIDVKG